MEYFVSIYLHRYDDHIHVSFIFYVLKFDIFVQYNLKLIMHK